MASSIHFSENPAYLKVKDVDDNSRTTTLRLDELVKARCPSLWTPFRPAWYLFNGHLQTIYNVLAGKIFQTDRVWYRRVFLRLKDGGTIGLDFYHGASRHRRSSHEEDDSSSTPVIVVMPGLTGGSYEPYVRAVLAQACPPVEEGGLGYRAVVVNHRGCGGAPLTSPALHCASITYGLRNALIYIAHKYPNAPILGLGFSAGANLGMLLLSEDGPERSRFGAFCGLGNPWNLKTCSHMIHNRLLHRMIYARAMGDSYQSLFKKHSKTLLSSSAPPEVKSAVTEVLALRRPTQLDIDETVWKKVGNGSSKPPFPFTDVDDYYLWSSSVNGLKDIKIPCLMINAGDDPIVPILPDFSAMKDNPYLVRVLTPAGGHLGWFTSKEGSLTSVERWTTAPVLAWLRLAGENLCYGPRTGPMIFEDKEGFLVEQRSQYADMGCIVVAGSEHLVDGCLEDIHLAHVEGL